MIVQLYPIPPLREVRESGVCEGDVEKNILNINELLYKVYYFNYWFALLIVNDSSLFTFHFFHGIK